MEILLNSLQYTIPSVVVMITAYLLITQFFNKEIRQQKYALLMNNQKIITPVRLQAYERIVLLLERLSPENLLPRTHTPGITVKEYRQMLLSNIRSEFDHNLSQQIYVSAENWDIIKLAKENMIKLVNIAARNLEPSAKASDLSKIIIEMYLKVESPPLQVALENIKKEFSDTFI